MKGRWQNKRPAVKKGQLLLFANEGMNGEFLHGTSVAVTTKKGKASTGMFYWSIPFDNPFETKKKGT